MIASRGAMRLLPIVLGLVSIAASTRAPASAAAFVFTLPAQAETGETVVAELANGKGPSEWFTVDWGDGASGGLLGDNGKCTTIGEAGAYKPGVLPPSRGYCTVAHAYRSPGTYQVVATTQKTAQTFTATITVTGPTLYEADGQFTFAGLGPLTVNSTPFTVSAAGPAPVCWLQFNGIKSTGPGSATFTLDVAGYNPSTTSSVVFVRFCDGGQDYAHLPTTVPFRISAAKVVSTYPDGEPSWSWHVENKTSEVATVSLTSDATTLGSATAPADDSATLTVGLPRQPIREPSRRYTLIIATPSGLRTELPVIAARGWTLEDGNAGPIVPPCSTIRWSYDATGQPRTSSLMPQDIQATLSRVSALTGLRFTRTPSPSAAQFRFQWTTSGLGEVEVTKDPGKPAIATFVLGAKNWWNADTWRGFSANIRQGVPGHNWSLAASMLYALGLRYTSQPRNLMNDTFSSSTETWHPENARFGIGDRAGLAYLYQPQTCLVTK